MVKLFRITTVPISMEKLISGQMRFMSNHGFEVFMVSSDYDNVAEIEQKELSKYVTINMTRTISPVKDLVSLWKMIVLFRSKRPSIIHTHTPKAGFIGMLAGKLSGVPIRLHTVAGLPLMESRGLKRTVLEFIERLTYGCATRVYPNSSNLKQFILSSNFCSPGKLKVLGNGSSNGIDTMAFKRSKNIDEEARTITLKFDIKPEEFVFVFVGRLVKDKGIEELVEAYTKFSLQYSNTKLLLVGPEEGDLDPLSESCVLEMHSNPNILLAGYQPDVRPYLSLSNVLVFPSYREGFPNVPLQAGCFDLPSIVTNINGCNEIILEGENGLIIPVKNCVALYNAMERIYLDKDLYTRLSLMARKLVVDRYEQTVMWDIIHGEYKQLLNEKQIV
jgi:glycosyltransferase involved in cell wall biosynthesis